MERDLYQDMAHAVTRYDRAQARSKHYNHYALGIMLHRCEDIAKCVQHGADLQRMIDYGFDDQLRDRVLIYLRKLGYPVNVSKES